MCKVACSTVILLLALKVSAAEVSFPPECPARGSMEIVESPKDWADQCFRAVTGRLPSYSSEANSEDRDVDLDGSLERLEIRGTGNASKQIYVFRRSEAGFQYLGKLTAHPSFEVVPDENGKATIIYEHRFGADDIREQRIQYIGNEFVLVNQ